MNETLTIVIPAFNESKRIPRALDDIDGYINKFSKPNLFQIIIVDDGSTDNTKDIVSDWISKDCKNKSCFQIVSYFPNKGKGYAVNQGFLHAGGGLVLYTDADGAAPIEELEKLQKIINEGYDIVIGSRVLKNNASKVSMSFTRKLSGRVFHSFLSMLDLADVKDTQCGFKLFKSALSKKLAQNQKCFGFSFDIEYLFLAKKWEYKIKEIPINWHHVGGSKVNIFRDSIKMLIEVIKIRFVYKYNNTDSAATR